jgi:hypothetical protein
VITSFNLSFAILERCDLPNVKIGKLEIDQPGLLAQGPEEKKALSGFSCGLSIVITNILNYLHKYPVV